MKYAFIMTLISAAALLAWAPDSHAACACVCLEGSERTVCDDQTEAGANRNICVDGRWQTDCPAPEGEIDPTVDATTPSGTANCVRARVWDPVTEAYREANVCDLAG